MKSIFVSLIGISAIALAIHGAANWLDMQPSPPDQKFEVVDRYQNRCDVIQYTPDNSARYSYFLDCQK
jgi:hypothetical protein